MKPRPDGHRSEAASTSRNGEKNEGTNKETIPSDGHKTPLSGHRAPLKIAANIAAVSSMPDSL